MGDLKKPIKEVYKLVKFLNERNSFVYYLYFLLLIEENKGNTRNMVRVVGKMKAILLLNNFGVDNIVYCLFTRTCILLSRLCNTKEESLKILESCENFLIEGDITSACLILFEKSYLIFDTDINGSEKFFCTGVRYAQSLIKDILPFLNIELGLAFVNYYQLSKNISYLKNGYKILTKVTFKNEEYPSEWESELITNVISSLVIISRIKLKKSFHTNDIKDSFIKKKTEEILDDKDLNLNETSESDQDIDQAPNIEISLENKPIGITSV